MGDFLDKDALDQAAALEAREISAEELMRLTLRRIEEVNGDVNAIVSLRDPDDLLAEARAADAAPRKGWMHGLPQAIKDLSNVKGLPTSMGSPIFEGQIAEADDIMVSRMRAAGAIIIGKTNTPEFGLGSHTFNPVHGATRNPYDLSCSAGGSSGGAAAAVACRMLPVADGSDMMGSLRNPAAWNNIYGFRPSWGRVPSEPHGETFLHQLATNGPMGRSPRDIAALLDVQSGPDPRQPHGYPAEPALPGIGTPVEGARVGWLGDWGGAYPMEDGLLDLAEAALPQLRSLGLTMEPVAPPFGASKIWEAWITLRSWAVAGGSSALYENESTRQQTQARGDLGDRTRAWVFGHGRAPRQPDPLGLVQDGENAFPKPTMRFCCRQRRSGRSRWTGGTQKRWPVWNVTPTTAGWRSLFPSGFWVCHA